jgi:mono/diheme cytochrome c family protein
VKLKKYWLPPIFFGAAVLSLSVTLLAIGARSPYTHANLDSKYTSDYHRTVQTVVGPAQPLQAQTVGVPNGDLVQQGQALFFGLNCATCHGLKGEGGVFAPIIQGVNATEIATNTSAGPGEMPKFAGLTDQDLQALAAYLKSVVPRGSAGK